MRIATSKKRNFSLFQPLIFVCLLALLSLQAEEKVCYFTPPQDWEIDLPSSKIPTLKVGFLGPKEQGYRPTLYLSTEKVDNCSLQEYIQTIREIYKGNPHTLFKEIGPFTAAGITGRLVEIEATTPNGVSKMLQFILVEEGYAYVLTGANLKERFLQTQTALLRSFKSATLIKDPYLLVEDKDKQDKLKSTLSTKEREELLKTEPAYVRMLIGQQK